MMQRQEDHHFTLEQVGQHLDDAISIVEARELPAELAAAALPGVLQMLSAKQITFIPGQPIGVPAMALPRGPRH
jgi:hypothetical protein